MPGPLVLALDLSTRTGWALGRDFESPRFGTWDLGARDTDGDGTRASRLAGAIEDLAQVARPDWVIYEAPVVKMQTSARLLIGLCLLVEMVCYERGVRYCEANVNSARKLVLGRGSFPAKEGKPRPSVQAKAAVKAWCDENGWKGGDDNANDALVLLRYLHLMQRAH